jgi:hypothetical protein
MLCRRAALPRSVIAAKNSTPERFRKHFLFLSVRANAFFFSVCASSAAKHVFFNSPREHAGGSGGSAQLPKIAVLCAISVALRVRRKGRWDGLRSNCRQIGDADINK